MAKGSFSMNHLLHSKSHDGYPKSFRKCLYVLPIRTLVVQIIESGLFPLLSSMSMSTSCCPIVDS